MLATHRGPVYPYVKNRRDFGRQPRFVRDRSRIHCNILSNKKLHQKFSKFRLIDKEVQACDEFALSAINTYRRIQTELGLKHSQGGWPADIDTEVPEIMQRYRKKLEKEESFQACLPSMFEKMEKYIKQNIALDYYGDMFKSKWKHPDPYHETPVAKTRHIYKDPSKFFRAVRKVIWAPDNVGRMGVCHCPSRYDEYLRDSPTEAYFWDVENASRPESQVRSESHITDIMYHPKDMHAICGSCFDGTVQGWDARVGPNAVAITPLDICHTDTCVGVRWVNSKTNSEFISAGTDGQVIWWDVRNLKERLETVYLDPEKGQARPEAALPATVLEFDHSIPTKFMAGTESGQVLVMMRKGKSPAERLANIYKAHRSPVINIQRNPTFVKNFLTVAESRVKIFSEDCKEDAIMWTAPKDVLYTHASWVPSRPSNFVVTRNDGYFDIYDLLKDPARPYCEIRLRTNTDGKNKITKFKKDRELLQDTFLTCASLCDPPSKFLAIGSNKGNVYLQHLSESLYMSDKSDKPVLGQCFERETRREKMIEQRYREIRLRKRDKDREEELAEKIHQERAEVAEKLAAEAKAEGKPAEAPDYSINNKYDLAYEARHDPICKMERQFYMDLEKEIIEKGVEAWPEFANVAKAQKGEDEVDTSEDTLDITASDLAAFAHVEEDEEEFDDDGKPIPKTQKLDPPKEEATVSTELPAPTGQHTSKKETEAPTTPESTDTEKYQTDGEGEEQETEGTP